VHHRIVEQVLANLDDERARYFGLIFQMLEHDPRAKPNPNVLYTVLKETVPMIPPYLEATDFLNLLFAFIHENEQKLTAIMFSGQFVTDPGIVRKVTDQFVNQVVAMTFDMHSQGQIKTGEPTVRRYSWPYENADFPFAD